MALPTTNGSGNKIGAALATQGLLTDVDTVQRNVLGTLSWDDLGNAHVYLPGVASCIIGSWCTYVLGTYVPALTITTSIPGGLVAVANGAILAANWGWFQVFGYVPVASIATATITVGQPLYASSTAGRATTTAAGAATLFGAFTGATSASNLGTAMLSFPFLCATSTL